MKHALSDQLNKASLMVLPYLCFQRVRCIWGQLMVSYRVRSASRHAVHGVH